MASENVIKLGDRQQQFSLVMEPATGIPMWATEFDELWCNLVGGNLYDFFKLHQDKLVSSTLDNPKDFAAAMSVYDFTKNFFVGETARFYDLIFQLKSILTDFSGGVAPDKMYVSFFSTDPSAEHFLNVALDNDVILIGARLGEKKLIVIS